MIAGGAYLEPKRRDRRGRARARRACNASSSACCQQKSRLAALGLAVSKINHDLRNLLAAAQLFSDRLTHSDDPVVQRFAPKLLQTLDRAIAFCQSTLSYGRAAEPPPARRMVLLAPIVTDTRELLGLGESEKPDGEVKIGWHEALEPDLHIDADPDQLSRVLLNLCRNAVQALETQGAAEGSAGCLFVTGRRDKKAVIIDVADNGPGVPEKARQKLFEAFAGSTRPGGSGLGLAIAAELVRAHGGCSRWSNRVRRPAAILERLSALQSRTALLPPR